MMIIKILFGSLKILLLYEEFSKRLPINNKWMKVRMVNHL